MEQANLKIPLTLIQDYKLSPLVCLLYGELSGLYFKHHKCDISDQTLSKRLNRSIPRIQSGLKELKDSGLITSKQKPNYRGRNITVAKTPTKPFLLIPVSVVRRCDISPSALLVYGWLNSALQKQNKINKDKYLEDTDTITSNKSKIAKELDWSTRFIREKIKELENQGYITSYTVIGKGLEITFTPIEDLPSRTKTQVKGMNKTRSGYEQNENPPMNKTRSEGGTKRATNRIFNRDINKGMDKNPSPEKEAPLRSLTVHTPLDKIFMLDPFLDPSELQSLSSPVYYDSLPDENSIPPETEKESYGDYKALNKLDTNKATSKHQQHKNNTNTGKSGSEVGASKISPDSASKRKTDQAHNKGTQSVKPTIQKNNVQEHYTAYDGTNLDYQCNAFKEILNKHTGKNYVITKQNKELLKWRLGQGFTLSNFESVITDLVNQGEPISIKELISNIDILKN